MRCAVPKNRAADEEKEWRRLGCRGSARWGVVRGEGVGWLGFLERNDEIVDEVRFFF